MNNNIIIGNILALVAQGFSLANGTRKKKRDMIICDMGAAISFTLTNVILKGYSGVIQNVVGVLRNITALFFPKDKYIGWLLVAGGVILGIYYNNMGFVGLLPVASAFWYSICVINKKASAKTLKMAFIINSYCFAAYGFALYNIVGAISDTVVGTITVYNYIKNKDQLENN